ncbi:spermidine synthase [Novosphingobium sediminis]|uniref:Spermidine synthase n=1 Tax=Novosphingobium sediminis TaxID=707214 RepID=A0A512AF39_9SPHN|nr:spermidine synthase [Novosphingobium sediminis]GEN98301.1 spermidine synthase [Novosphingobium sediminis]
MIARELLGTAQVPGGTELKLYRHDRDFMIVMGHNELMSSRMSGSEIALATETIKRLKGRTAPCLLIGGYGMGFTLRAAQEVLGPKAELVVAELVPEIIEWARGPMAELAAGCLDDPRVRLIMGDVGSVIDGAAGDFDAILLDVDNGPDGVVRDGNNSLYTSSGLRAARRALTPGGVLAVWSAGPDPAFTRRLEKNGFSVDEIRVAARTNGKGPKHTIWFATPA